MTKDKSPEIILGISLEFFLVVDTIVFTVLVNFLLTVFFSSENFNSTRVKQDVVAVLLYNCPNYYRKIIIKHSLSLEGLCPSIPFIT